MNKTHHPECEKFLETERTRLAVLAVVDEAYVQTQCICDLVSACNLLMPPFLAGRDLGDETECAA